MEISRARVGTVEMARDNRDLFLHQEAGEAGERVRSSEQAGPELILQQMERMEQLLRVVLVV